MVTMAQRLIALRDERGLNRAALSAELGFPQKAAEKFETGRVTPTKEQQEKLASFFGVSLFYLRGESSDRTRQEDWMSAAGSDGPTEYVPAPKLAKPAPPAEPQGALFDAMLASKQVQALLRGLVLDTLKSPEGQAIIVKAIRKEHGGT